jgi:hypothetical protein
MATSEAKTRLVCTVNRIGAAPFSAPTTFDLADEARPRFLSGAGYIDGILPHFAAALDHWRWQVRQFGWGTRVAMGGYYYEFREIPA